MRFYPKPKPLPLIGDIKNVKRFTYLPRRCPISGIIYWLEYCNFQYKYCYRPGDDAYNWHLVEIKG